MGASLTKEEVESVKKRLNLSAETTKHLLRAFVSLGCGGSISRDEFSKFVSDMRTDSSDKKDEWNTVFNMLDLDGNQVIDFYEFSVAMIYHSKLTNEEKIEYIFKMVDFDKDRKVSYVELRKAVDAASRIKLAKKASVTNMKALFPELAEGKKDELNEDEFKAALRTEKGKEFLSLMELL